LVTELYVFDNSISKIKSTYAYG